MHKVSSLFLKAKHTNTHTHTNKPEALKSLYRSPGYKKKPIGPM